VSEGANLEKEEYFTKNKVIDPEFHLEDGIRIESSSEIIISQSRKSGTKRVLFARQG